MQLWCPFENSPMDRALYIWGCGRTGCQAKAGSVRAWRGLRFNEKYAAKLEKRLAKEKAGAAEAQANVAKKAVPSNPFSMSNSSGLGSFGLGAQIFGDVSSPSPSPENDAEVSDSESTSSEQSLLTAMASTALEESPWKPTPAYPSLYLSTVSEYLPPQPKLKVPDGVSVVDPDEAPEKDISWAFEPYENSLEVDHVFERFTKRVGYEGDQCIRYELNGTPLPFSFDKTFELLFPKADSKVVNISKRNYDPSKIAPCPFCHSKRIFECQIMPNLINVLRDDHMNDLGGLNDEARRQAVQKALKGEGDMTEKRGMEWGTCMVFSCEKDCRIDDKGAEMHDVWREEVVLIQGDVY